MEVTRFEGVVKWFDPAKGYGFVNVEGDDVDYFVHYSYIEMEGYKKLVEGQPVTFKLVNDDKGLQAQEVQII